MYGHMNVKDEILVHIWTKCRHVLPSLVRRTKTYKCPTVYC